VTFWSENVPQQLMERTEERFTYMDKKGKRKGRSTMGQVIIMDGYMEAGS
jgi:hypothetical protein